MMPAPNFFIIGAAKAATTTLATLLDTHPEAGIAHGKEPHFFSVDTNFRAGRQAYLQLFKHCTGKLAIGDASTSYSRIRNHPETARRIHAHVPEARIIYMVRHPLRRIESAYVERLATASRMEPYANINEAVRRQPTLVDSSRYWEVYEHYRTIFSEKRILVIWFEEFIADLGTSLRDVCRFLSIDASVPLNHAAQKLNSRDDARRRMAALDSVVTR